MQETTPEIQDISQINTGDMVESSEASTFMGYIYSWGFILLVFWTIIAGSVILWQFSHYFSPNYNHSNGYYKRGKIDDTSYVAIGVASLIIGFILTIATLWIYSMTRTEY